MQDLKPWLQWTRRHRTSPATVPAETGTELSRERLAAAGTTGPEGQRSQGKDCLLGKKGITGRKDRAIAWHMQRSSGHMVQDRQTQPSCCWDSSARQIRDIRTQILLERSQIYKIYFILYYILQGSGFYSSTPNIKYRVGGARMESRVLCMVSKYSTTKPHL